MSQTVSFEELPGKIAARAAQNPEFRREFVADPRAAFSKYTDLKLPEGTQVRVHEQKPGELHFVLPPVPERGKLSEADLEKVAGGVEVGITVAVLVTGVTVASSWVGASMAAAHGAKSPW